MLLAQLSTERATVAQRMCFDNARRPLWSNNARRALWPTIMSTGHYRRHYQDLMLRKLGQYLLIISVKGKIVHDDVITYDMYMYNDQVLMLS